MAYGRIYLQIIYKRGDNNIPWQLITTHNKFLLIKSCNNKNKSKKETKQTKKNHPTLESWNNSQMQSKNRSNRGKIDTYIYDCSLSWLGSCTSIKKKGRGQTSFMGQCKEVHILHTRHSVTARPRDDLWIWFPLHNQQSLFEERDATVPVGLLLFRFEVILACFAWLLKVYDNRFL